MHFGIVDIGMFSTVGAITKTNKASYQYNRPQLNALIIVSSIAKESLYSLFRIDNSKSSAFLQPPFKPTSTKASETSRGYFHRLIHRSWYVSTVTAGINHVWLQGRKRSVEMVARATDLIFHRSTPPLSSSGTKSLKKATKQSLIDFDAVFLNRRLCLLLVYT